MSRAMVAFGAAAIITACTATPLAPQHSAGASRCLPSDQIVGRRAAGDNAVEFELAGGAVYRNELQGSCPALARLGTGATISIVAGGEGGRLCSGDRIHVADPVETLPSLPPITCVLADFHAVPRK